MIVTVKFDALNPINVMVAINVTNASGVMDV
jgi:hypothetical protein